MSRSTFAARAIVLAAVLGGTCLLAAADAAASARTTAAADAAASARTTAAASGAPSTSLRAAFEPERLGGRTTLRFGFRIAGPGGEVPPALTAVSLSYPESLGIAFSRLGLVTCTAAQLEASGVSGCQQNSIMGFGSATAEISLGSDVVGEPVPFTILRAPDEEGHISLLFDAAGTTPLNTSAVFAGALLPAPPPYGGQVSIYVPLIPSVPGAPDVSIVRLRATLGPIGVIYFRPLEGRTIVYQPPGFLLPDSCPKGGFPFAAQFSFVDGSHASARTVEPCPARAARRRR
ncbi:MAG TPA: hypothetical protein VIJ66_11805 [Solirubrobacteraceae bacterium]